MFKLTKFGIGFILFLLLAFFIVSAAPAANYFPPVKAGTIQKYIIGPDRTPPQYWYTIPCEKQVINGLSYYINCQLSHEGEFEKEDRVLFRGTGEKMYIRHPGGLEHLFPNGLEHILFDETGDSDFFDVCLFLNDYSDPPCGEYTRAYPENLEDLTLADGSFFPGSLPVQGFGECYGVDDCLNNPGEYYDYYAEGFGIVRNEDADGEIMEYVETIPPEIGWFATPRRVYENGDVKNTFYFGFQTDLETAGINDGRAYSYAPLDDYIKDISSSVSISHEGSPVTLINGTIFPYPLAFNLDVELKDIEYFADFYGEINSLNSGEYTLDVVDVDGNSYQAKYTHDNNYPDLPFIRAHTFSTEIFANENDGGRYYWKWSWIMDTEPELPENHQLRPWVAIYNGSNLLGSYFLNRSGSEQFIEMPYETHIVPGNRVEVSMQIRFEYGYDLRHYSNSISVPAFDLNHNGIADGMEDLETAEEEFAIFETFGHISQRGTGLLSIVDEYINQEGESWIHIKASCADTSGTCSSETPTMVRVCGSAVFSVKSGDEITFRCGSVDSKIHQGIVEILYIADDGTESTAVVGEGNGLYFDPSTNIFVANDENPDPIVVSSGDKDIVLVPGDTKMFVDIDIRPRGKKNRFNNNGHGVLPVAILGSDMLDVELIDVGSLSLEGLDVRVRGRWNKTHSRLRDVNKDGFIDLVVRFDDDGSMGDVSDGIAVLTGSLDDGTPIEGADNICLVP